jgi:hypothetical protein
MTEETITNKLYYITQVIGFLDSLVTTITDLRENTIEKDKIGKEILPYVESFLLISSKRLGYSIILILQSYKTLRKAYRVTDYVHPEEFADFSPIGVGNAFITQPILSTLLAYFSSPVNIYIPYSTFDLEVYQLVRKNKGIDSNQLKQHLVTSKDTIKSVTLANNMVQIFYKDDSFDRFTIIDGNVDSIKETLNNLFKPIYNSTSKCGSILSWVNEKE